jgi:aspartate kinase
MSLIVQKFGGTSVANPERIRSVAKRVAAARAAGHSVAVVVSAMSGETNRLLALGRDMASRPLERELDALAATGEQVTSALLAIALADLGVPARSLLGHQVRILTDSAFTKARIMAIDASQLTKTLEEGSVAVIAGFQGIDEGGSITTLGRGGSDTTAVAIAAAVKADACEIYTDVDGVYTADPNLCPSARKIDRISYEEMLELASLGAKVLQIRSVEVAMKYGVPVHVRSSFSDVPGTWVVGEDKSFEAVIVAGVTSDKNETKITIRHLPDEPGIVARIFEPLAAANISVDMIIQNVSADRTTDLTFTVTRTDAIKGREIAERIAKEIGAKEVTADDDIAKVSIVGLGMRSHAGIASRMFRLLANEGINIEAISTSEIKVSCVIAAKYHELAVRVLHDGFGLGKAT